MNKFTKGAISVALALNLISPTAFAAAVAFDDVPVTHWAHNAITDMAERGIVKGVGDNKFAPSGTVTYAEFVTMLTREFYGATDSTTGEAWYTPYITVAQNKHLLDGCKTGYAPTDTINRYDMAMVMYNHLKAQGTSTSNRADSSTISDWSSIPANYQDAVSICYGMKLLQGKDSSGAFDGMGTMTRAEAATVVQRLLGDDTPTTPSTSIPAGAVPVTDKNVEKIKGNNSYYEDGVFHIRVHAGWLCYGGLDLVNPGYDYLTFTVTTYEPQSEYNRLHGVSIGCPDSFPSAGVMLVEFLEPYTTKTYTVNVSGMKHLDMLTDNGPNYTNCDISNIYFHN